MMLIVMVCSNVERILVRILLQQYHNTIDASININVNDNSDNGWLIY